MTTNASRSIRTKLHGIVHTVTFLGGCQKGENEISVVARCGFDVTVAYKIDCKGSRYRGDARRQLVAKYDEHAAGCGECEREFERGKRTNKPRSRMTHGNRTDDN